MNLQQMDELGKVLGGLDAKDLTYVLMGALAAKGIDTNKLRDRAMQLGISNEAVNPAPKSSVVIYRYVRPMVFPHGGFSSGEYDAKKGLTLRFELDFDARKIITSWSICNGDNFEKSVGRDIATERRNRGEAIIDDMPETTGKWEPTLVDLLFGSLEKLENLGVRDIRLDTLTKVLGRWI